jgi:type II secretory pathway component GspD/PulD (secretin)
MAMSSSFDKQGNHFPEGVEMMVKSSVLRAHLLAVFCLASLLVLWSRASAQVELFSGGENLVTLDADNASLSSIFQVLTEKSGWNIVTGPSVEDRKISVRVVDVPVEEAFDLVVKAAGLGYEKIGGSILVEDPQSLGEEASLQAFVIPLNYADATEVKEILKDMSPFVRADAGGNQLVVIAGPKVKGEILDIVAKIDRPVVQVVLQAKLVEVSVDDLLRMGIDWDKLNSVTNIIAEGIPDPSSPNQLPEEMPYEVRDLGGSTMSRQLKAFEVVVDFLINEGKAKLLADTKLTTMNNREANVHIGDIVPYVVTTYAAGTGGVTEMARIEKEKVGIKMKITPHVSEDGFITTRIEPEVSSIIGWVGPNNDIPWVKTRQATTTVRVKDGQTIVIAGLLNEEKTTQISKLPILGHIPILGKLFQHSMISTKKTDLIVEITPKIITG